MTNELSQQNNEKNLTLKERLALRRSPAAIDALLLDCSSSMAIDIEPGKSRHQALKEIILEIQAKRKYRGKIFYFNYGFSEIDVTSIPEPSGGTVLADLLEHIKSLGCKSCLIITDGEVHDQYATLKAKNGLKIRVMFVGSVKPAFLDELATDGMATVEDLTKPILLAEKIQLLLSSGDTQEKRPIEL